MFRSLLLAFGIALAGWFASRGFVRARTAERTVTVKGFSEREVRAGLAIWPLRVAVSDNDLAKARSKLDSDIGQIRAFLARHGLHPDQIELQDFFVTDAFSFQPGDRVASRYTIRQTVMVRSGEPDKILDASQQIGELVGAGVVLSSGSEFGGGGPTFVFKGVNELKPEMIAEATARARQAAEQFARDSRSKIGGIRRAHQGLFEILPRDEAPGVREESQIAKTVRVVATLEYYLND